MPTRSPTGSTSDEYQSAKAAGDAAEMGQRLRQIRDMEPEELQKLKTSVIQSVKNSGAQTLANYIQTIYYNIYQKQPPKKPPLFHLPSSLTALARRK